MAHLHSSSASLRIFSDDLIPDEITSLLGATPSSARTKGDQIVGKNTGQVRIAKTGSWHLNASDREPADLNVQIHEMLSQATPDIAVWQSITKKYRADLFCGLFMRVNSEGLTISAASLAALGARGIELGLCIYGGDDEDEILLYEADRPSGAK